MVYNTKYKNSDLESSPTCELFTDTSKIQHQRPHKIYSRGINFSMFNFCYYMIKSEYPDCFYGSEYYYCINERETETGKERGVHICIH